MSALSFITWDLAYTLAGYWAVGTLSYAVVMGVGGWVTARWPGPRA
jgi:hypothetical protein